MMNLFYLSAEYVQSVVATLLLVHRHHMHYERKTCNRSCKSPSEFRRLLFLIETSQAFQLYCRKVNDRLTMPVEQTCNYQFIQPFAYHVFGEIMLSQSLNIDCIIVASSRSFRIYSQT